MKTIYTHVHTLILLYQNDYLAHSTHVETTVTDNSVCTRKRSFFVQPQPSERENNLDDINIEVKTIMQIIQKPQMYFIRSLHKKY